MRTATVVDRALGVTAWVVIGAGVLVELVLHGPAAEPEPWILLGTLGIFFAVLCARIVLTLARRRRGEWSLLLLLAGVLGWAAESALTVNAPMASMHGRFAPNELLFFGAYLAFLLYLLFDVGQRRGQRLGSWLEVAVLCGGSASVASVALLTPITHRFGGGIALLLAVSYPVCDLLLATVVLGQIGLRVRARTRRSVGLAVGFALLALADSTFTASVKLGDVGTTLYTAVLWGAGFALIVGAACQPRPAAPQPSSRTVPATVLLLASVAAVVVLALHPGGALGACLVPPAALTLLAAGGRLVLALHEARDAAEAFRLSRTDDLTRLPNRRAVLAWLDRHIAADGPLGLVLLDLNGFKEINDGLGHLTGDAVLEVCARRMREALPADVLVGRFGGDEFAIAVADDDPVGVLEIAQLARAALSAPAHVDGLELVVDAAAGVAVRAPGERQSVSLMHRADVAMYQAKTSGAGALVYDPAHDEHTRAKLQLAEELRHALADGQIVLWYQPLVDASTLQIRGFEALVRWQHPVHGVIAPMSFLPLARHAGLMGALSETVAATAVADVRRWREQGADLRVSLNCAAPELLSGVFARRLEREARAQGVPLTVFTIEVTEDSFLADPERARAALRSLRTLGVRVSIDDYGTGFSSLAYLRDLPLDELKLDRSFVSVVVDDRRSRMIVESTLRMAHALELSVVGEGVENGAVSAALVALGADTLQGYHLARPMPAAEVLGWMAEHADACLSE
jgi:diguanylate cyclase (GGDEF)-like protein